MKKIEEFEKYFNDIIKPKLQPLEEERKSVKTKIIITCIILLVIFIFMINFFMQDIRLILGYFVVSSVIIGLLKKGYTSNFKDLLIKDIIKFISEDLVFNKSGKIDENQFRKSKLFTDFNRYDGEDYISGEIEYKSDSLSDDKLKLEFSELSVEKEVGSGKDRRVITIFNGMFYVVDFNKEFEYYTKIIPDSKKGFFKRKDRVMLEDDLFEKIYEVYSESQFESRYILSTSMMERLVEFYKKRMKNIYLAFNSNKVYIAVESGTDYFEPKIFTSLYKFDIIKEYYEDLEMVISVIEELKLNIKIWSKK